MAFSLPNSSLSRNNHLSKSVQWLTLVPKNALNSPAYSLKVHEDPANQIIRSIHHPLNLVAVLGPMRSGKSTLLNLLSSADGNQDQFDTGAGIDSVTKGAFITYPTTSQVESSNDGRTGKAQQISAAFVDTEGKGDQGHTYEVGLLCPILMVSKIIIFNCNYGLQSNQILQELGVMMQAASKLWTNVSRNGSPDNSENDSKSARLFSHLFIVFNQIRPNTHTTVNHVKSRLFDQEPEIDHESQQRNIIRRFLHESFESIDVFLLPDLLKITTYEAVRNGEDKHLHLDDFENSFVEAFDVLNNSVWKALKEPRTLPTGAVLTGTSVSGFMVRFANSLQESEAIHIPTLYETVQNHAVNQAYDGFSRALKDQYETLVCNLPLSVTTVRKEFEKFTDELLTKLDNDIAYMPPRVVERLSDETRKVVQTTTNELVQMAQDRIRKIAEPLLEEEKKSILIEIQIIIDNKNAMMQHPEIEEQCRLMKEAHIANLRKTCKKNGIQDFSEEFESIIEDTVDKGQIEIAKASNDAWDLLKSSIEAAGDGLRKTLQHIRQNIPFGKEESYGTKEEEAYAMALDQIKLQLPQELSISSRQQVGTKFQDMAEVIRRESKSYWYDEKKTRDIILKEFNGLVIEYRSRLAESLGFQQQPAEYHKITQDADIKKILENLCTHHSIALRLRTEVMSSFSAAVLDARHSFTRQYQDAVKEFLSNLEGKLENQISEAIWKFDQQLDLIGHEKHNVTNNGRTTALQCTELKEATRLQFMQGLRQMVKEPTDSVRMLERVYERKLDQGLQSKLQDKLSRFNIVVGHHNLSLRNRLLAPIEDRVFQQEYSQATDFQQDVEHIESKFHEQAWGAADSNGDAKRQWQHFKDTTYLDLKAEVERASQSPFADANDLLSDAETLQRQVIERILPECVKLATWFTFAQLSVDRYKSPILDLGITNADSPDENIQVMRTFRATCGPGSTLDRFLEYLNGIKPDLEFFDWKFEISDVSWGRPIVTESTPRILNEYEYDASPATTQTKIGTQTTKTTTFTNNIAYGAKTTLESSTNIGCEKVWLVGLKTMVTQDLSFMNNTTATSTYMLNTEHTLNIPPNSPCIISQSVSDQRARCAYTATVKMVPRLRIRGKISPGVFKSFPFFTPKDYELTACDRLISETKRESEIDWKWLLSRPLDGLDLESILIALSDAKKYSFRVKGYWEGVTGEKVLTRYRKKVI